MHRLVTARLLNRALRIGETSTTTSLPVFLCPTVGNVGRFSTTSSQRNASTTGSPEQLTASESRSQTHSAEAATAIESSSHTPTLRDAEPVRRLPMTCHGCGAYAQTHSPDELGFYDLRQRRVKHWMHPPEVKRSFKKGENVVDQVLECLGEDKLKEFGLDATALQSKERPEPETMKPPVCDRCHNIQHYRLGHPKANIPVHPITINSLRETMEETTHKVNHVYHVIDAADFPMSLVPRLHKLLGDIPLRSKNRRSVADKYQQNGRKVTMSFIITKADLLAPQKWQVDKMVPFLREILRDALTDAGISARLGNVTCVSARRHWWTSFLKDAIKDRGGASWLVGKTNVGKSQLFEAIYPKGVMGDPAAQRAARAVYDAKFYGTENKVGQPGDEDEQHKYDESYLQGEEDHELLPPPQPPREWPDMPVVSALPGTTASPIRQTFAKGKGELIDLPGLDRKGLSEHVEPRYWSHLVWEQRNKPQQVVVKKGQSLILGGGLVRITPTDPMDFLMYNFTPMREHLTATEKAKEFQAGTLSTAVVKNITKDGSGELVKHAGNFELKYDVTKLRAGPLTRKDGVGMKVRDLPFRVVSLDLLIEGVGYIEICAQMRARNFEFLIDPDSGVEPVNEFPTWPSVDVFTPEGRYVGSRRPISGWMMNKPRVLKKHLVGRPRKSMKGAQIKFKQALKKRQAEDSTDWRLAPGKRRADTREAGG